MSTTKRRNQAAVEHRRNARRTSSPVSDPIDTVWLALIPCTTVVLLVALLGGPLLADIIYPAHSPYTFWRSMLPAVQPEPIEQSRYLLLLGGPTLLSLCTAIVTLRAPFLQRRFVTVGTAVVQLLVVAFLGVCLVVQYRYVYGTTYTFEDGVTFHRQYFTPATLVVAAVIAVLLAAAARDDRFRRRFASWTRETRGRAAAAFALAFAMTAIWLLQAVNTESSIATAVDAVSYHLEFTLGETFAVLNGRSPLVDFTAQYGSLLPYVAALPLLVFGKSLLVFTLTMTGLTAISMMAVFDVLRRVTGRAATALLLYLPFLATSFFMIRGDFVNRYSMAAYFGAFPLRIAGPFLVMWLVARRVQRGDARFDLALFTVAGLVLLNNTDYGIAALGASVAAIAWTMGEPHLRPLARLVATAIGGLVVAVVLVSLLTLLRAGTLPQFDRLLEYARIYTMGGFAMLPVPGVIGLHTIIYVTYVAAIAAAMVRALASEPNRVLTGMLSWTGVFGLGSAAYYMGRSHPEALVSTFSAWALALALLAVVAVQSIAKRGSRLPSIVSLTALFGIGVSACSLAQTPTPWTQAERLAGRHTAKRAFIDDAREPFLPQPRTRAFFSASVWGSHFYYKRGAPVAILVPSGHRIADAFGVVNVSRYTGTSIVGPEMLHTVIDDLRAAGGNTLFLPESDRGMYDLLDEEGFKVLTPRGLEPFRGKMTALAENWTYGPVMMWVDTRNLRPRYLREGRGRLVHLPDAERDARTAG